MASLNSNSVSGITTDIFLPSQGVNKKYVDDNIPVLPAVETGGGKFLVTTDGVSITWSDISNVEEFAKVGISTYYIPEMASAVHIEAVGGGQAGNNPKGCLSRADDEKMEIVLGCNYAFGYGWRHVGDVIYANGHYALTRSCGNPLFSTDGLIWSVRTIGADVAPASPFYDQKDTNSIDYHGGLWLIAGRNNFDSTCMTTCGFAGVSASTDTFHWSLRTLANPSSNKYSFADPGGLKYLNNLWYLVASDTTCSVQVSTDTIHWTLRTTPAGGGKITWSGEHYAYYGTGGRITSSTDGIHWFLRTMAYMSTCSGHADEGMLAWHSRKNVWVAVTHPYIGTVSSYPYADHIHSSTDTIHWTLRTFPFNTNATSVAQGCPISDINHHCCSNVYYQGLASVGDYLYLNGCVSRCSTCECILNDTYYMYAPLFSTDAIHWIVDDKSPNDSSPFNGTTYFCNDTFYYQIATPTWWGSLFNVNNKLLLAGSQSYRGIVQSTEFLDGGGSGGSGGNYSLFSVDPKLVIDRKLEVNVGAGGTVSQEDFRCGCVGAGTTISYLSQEGTTSYYFNGTNSCIKYATNSKVGGFTGPYTIEFWMRADVNCNSVSDVIIESHLSTCTNCDPWCMRVQSSNTLQFIIDGYQAFTTPTTANGQDSLWHHHAIVYDGTFLKYYFDGENVRTCTSGTCLFPSQPSDSITLGRSSKANSNHFCGYLSGIRIDNGIARYKSNFIPASPDLQQNTRTVFLAGVKSSRSDQTGVMGSNAVNVGLCTSTCLPEIKVRCTVGGGQIDNVFDCFGGMRMSRGGAGQGDPTTVTTQCIFTPFQAPGGGAGGYGALSGGSSTAMGYWSGTKCSTGGQSGYSNASTIYGTGGGGGSAGSNGAPGYRGSGGGGGGAQQTGGWSIIMASNCADTSTSCCFGCPGTTAWTTITESGTGANARTGVGDGEGIYSGFFNTTNITKIAFVHGHAGGSDLTPGSGGAWTRYLVYDLVESTGSETLYEILKRLDTYNKNNPSWARCDGCFNANSARCFVAGDYTSGCLSEDSGHFKASTCTTCTPDKFAIWGVNEDSDNDTQALVAYWGCLAPGNGKGDQWRYQNPPHTFFSYWGGDWHSNSCSQTIGGCAQTYTGVIPNAVSASSGIDCSSIVYMLAFEGSSGASTYGCGGKGGDGFARITWW